jgi:hypothetical protein
LAGDQQHTATAVGHGGDALGGECLDLPDSMIGKKMVGKKSPLFSGTRLRGDSDVHCWAVRPSKSVQQRGFSALAA